MKKIYLSIFFSICFLQSHAQTITSLIPDNSTLDMSLEYRPRTEYRRGYRSLPSSTDNGAFSTSHRARINVDFNLNKTFSFHTTLQDIRIWGDTDTRNADGKAQFYEFYVEPKISEHISVRVGRQRIKYDNQRLFAENNWRQAGGQHDAVRFLYNNQKNLTSDLILAYNQDNAQEFGNEYQIDWDFYRGMATHLLNYRVDDALIFTTINIADEYTDPNTDDEIGHWKYTHGGRMTYKTKTLDFSLAGYYQWGKIENGIKHNAYYIEPEITWKARRGYTIKIGSQIFSGDRDNTDQKSTAFLAQYGAFHKHNGALDYTQKTVRTNQHEGILNPYIFQIFQLNKKWKLNWQSHLLGATTDLLVDGEKQSSIYAWENDFHLHYQPNTYTHIDLSYMFLKADRGIQALDTGSDGNINQLAQFAYLAINWTPKFLNIQR